MPLVSQISRAAAKVNHHLPIWLLAALVFAALWLHTFRLIHDDRASALVGAESDVVNLARLSQEHAERIFYSADQTLHLVRSEYKEKAHGGQLDLQGMRAQGVFDRRTILQVSVVDAQGFLRESSLPLSDRLNVSDQAYFKAHVAATSDALFVSPPEFDLAYGRWAIRLSRPILDDFGGFRGIIVVSLDPTYFTHFYGELDIGRGGVAALYGLTGTLFARKAQSNESFSGEAAKSPIFARVAQGAQEGTLTYPGVTDGIERIYHFKKLPSYPLLVLIGEA